MFFGKEKRLLVNRILNLGLSKSFHEVQLELRYNGTQLSMSIPDGSIPIKAKGLYAIYTDENECLYVGESEYCVSQRIRRFFKELANCSNPNEYHSGATYARNDGYTIYSHKYKVKYISSYEIYKIERECQYSAGSRLDECVAYYLRSKYNSITALPYYKGATISSFFGD
jgi:hypothetical protein